MTMMLQVNSRSSCPLKYHPLQHAGSVKPSQPPSEQAYGLVHRSQKYTIKCSFRSSLHSTNKIGNNDQYIINRKNKTFNKSTVPTALQDDNASKSQVASFYSTSFVDVLKKKLDALYRFSRPYAWISIIIGISSSSLLPVQSVNDLTPRFFTEVLKSMVPTIMMHIFVAAINHLSDVEIDKVNKPDLPLASGDLSIGEGIAIAVISTLTSLGMGIMLRSPPLVIGIIVRWILGAAYSINLPLLRWKGSPLMAALTCMTLNGLLLQFPFFIHVQKYVLGRPVVFTKTLLFAAAFMGIFSVVLTFLKDIPDMEGDKEFGVRTLPLVIGKERAFSISVNMLLMAYGGGVLAGATSRLLLCKLVAVIGHSALGFILWHRSRTIDLSNTKSTYSFFIFVFQLYYAEFFLLHFVR